MRFWFYNIFHNIKLNWNINGRLMFGGPLVVAIILADFSLFPGGHVISGYNISPNLRVFALIVVMLWCLRAIIKNPMLGWFEHLSNTYDPENLKSLVKQHLFKSCDKVMALSSLLANFEANERVTIYIQDTTQSFLRFYRYSANENQKNKDPKSLILQNDIVGTCFNNTRNIYHNFGKVESPSQWVKKNKNIYPNMDQKVLHGIKMKSAIYYAQQFKCNDEKIGVIVFETTNESLYGHFGNFFQKLIIKHMCKAVFKKITKLFKYYYKYVKIMKEVEGLENE